MRPPHPAVAIVRHSREYELDIRREAEALVDAGLRVEVLYLGEPGSPRVVEINGVTLRRLPGSKTRGGRFRYLLEYGSFLVVAGAVLAARHMRRRYRAVQVNTMPDFMVFAALVPKLLGARVVVFMQEPTPELAQTLGAGPRVVRLFAFIEQRALRFADHAITVTDRLRARYVESGADPDHISVVLNGPDPRHVLGTRTDLPERRGEPGRLEVMCHGTIEDRYGHDVLIDAVALAARDIPSLELVVTGRGGGTDAMIARIEARGVGNLVRYEGWVSEERLAELLHEADVGIVAQKASPYSHLVHTNKMYDYWIAGLPVIASRLDATAADFDDATIAYFAPGDAADLARQLVRLAWSPATRRDLAVAGRRAYDRVGWHRQRERYLDVFRSLLSDVLTEPEPGRPA